MDEGRRTMQLEVGTEKMDQLEKLIDCIKEKGLLKPIWGRWLNFTKPVNYDSSRGDINRMMQFPQEQIQCLSTETAWIAFHVYNYTHPKILKSEFVEILEIVKLLLDFGIDEIDPSM